MKFTSKNDYIISTGGGEKSIFQWKYVTDDRELDDVPDDDDEDEQEKEEEIEEVIVEKELIKGKN